MDEWQGKGISLAQLDLRLHAAVPAQEEVLEEVAAGVSNHSDRRSFLDRGVEGVRKTSERRDSKLIQHET